MKHFCIIYKMSEENDVNDTSPIPTENLPFTNESWDDKQENSPSLAEEQEVNKPLVGNLNHEQSEFPSLFAELQAAQNISEPLNANTSAIPNNETNGHIQKKPKRNVSFPNDSDLVMGFLEPPDPWKNLPEWRTQDLMRAYKLSCDKHGAKPLNKILQQLQCIENVGERYEILSLKGERLDLKQIESLEEIFRHVRFRCIDLEATHLDDEMAVAMFEMVEYYESACKLNISFNKNIGPRGWQSCSRLVRKTPCLTFIDARNCDLNERVVPFIGRALRMGCYLTRLHLQSANIAGRALIILVAALKMNETLKELSIGDNKFMPTDGVHIGNLLKYNHKLELLDLRNNHLQDTGASHIADGLAEQNVDSGLLTLVLWNNQITFQAMSSINKSLITCEFIETLNVGHNPITNEGIHVLKDGLLKSKSLLKLGLSSTKVTCEGAVALAEVIADNNRLVRVDLQENDIKTAGLMALSLALKVNESLTRLDLDRDTKKESGVKDYIDQQKRLQQDISAALDRNRDLARQREEERRQIELKNEENARKLQEAANEVDLTQEEQEVTQYIPSGDSVHRPKLLFLSPASTVNSLDSPAIGTGTFLASAVPENTTLQLSSMEGPDLLSPQYCPDPKTAKKIFSVSQVVSPMMPSPVGDYVNRVSSDGIKGVSCPSVPVPQFCTPLSSLDLPNQHPIEEVLTPNTLQRDVEEQTLESYIQDIIGQPCDSSANNTVEEKVGTNDANASIKFTQDHNSSVIEANAELKDMNDKEDGAQMGKNGAGDDKVIDISNDKEVIYSNSNDSGLCNDEQVSPDKIVNSIQQLQGESDKKSEIKAVSSNATGDDNTQIVDNKTVDKSFSQSNGEIVDVNNVQKCDNKSDNIPGRENISEIPDDKSTDVCVENINKNASSCDTPTTQHCMDKAQIVRESIHDNQSSSQSDPTTGDSQISKDNVDASERSVVDKNDQSVSGLNIENDANSLSSERVENDSDENSITNNYHKVDASAIHNELPKLDSEQKDARNSADAEPWSTVSESELPENESLVLVSPSDSDNNGNTNKPDFFSSLTMNGLKQELASLIDDEGNHSNSTQSPSQVNGNQSTQAVPNASEMTKTNDMEEQIEA